MQRRLDAEAPHRAPETAKGVTIVRPASDDGLLATAVPIMIVAYGAALGVATYTFWRSGYTLLSIGICAVYMVMFFGVPIAMARIRNRHDERHRVSDVTGNRVEIFGGTIGRSEALLQMTIVPLVVVFAFAAFAMIWLFVKP